MKHRPSLFGPLMLVAIGVLWIMSNLGRVEPANFWALVHFFPYALILLGLGLIVKAYWAWTGEVVSVLVVILGVLAVVYAPQLNWSRAPLEGRFPFFVVGPGQPASGEMTTQERSVSGFDSVEIAIPAEVIVTQGASEALTIEAQADVLADLQTRVSGGRLYIGYPSGNWKNYVMPTDTVRINLTVKDLEAVSFSTAGRLEIQKLETKDLKLTLSGAGELNLTGLRADSLECTLSGAGSLHASGEVDEFDVSISGMGSVDAPDLRTQKATVHISGAGSATVWVEESLNASISGAGSVDYYGDPAVTKDIGGLGSVNKRGDK